MARKKERPLGTEKKVKSKKKIVFLAVFVIGFIIGAYAGMQLIPQLIGLSQQNELQDCLTAKTLLSQEVDCFIENCSQEAVGFCGEK